MYKRNQTNLKIQLILFTKGRYIVLFTQGKLYCYYKDVVIFETSFSQLKTQEYISI